MQFSIAGILARVFCFALAALLDARLPAVAEAPQGSTFRDQEPFQRKINFISTLGKRRTPNPPGWEAYGGSVYKQKRGYGWVTPLTGLYAADGGQDAAIRLSAGVLTSPLRLGRLELANWQGAHRENHPLVFRIDLPSGWYRVTCASAGFLVLPVVDQRSFKCRAHDAVFAGPPSGVPLKVGGEDLVEGSAIVEVTDGHLRVVVGDPAYGGWTWSYQGPWYGGWWKWWGRWGEQRYAETWRQKFTRVIDPGFHHLRLNSLEIERVPAPVQQPSIFFRDFFNRDDNSDINAGVAEADHWRSLHSSGSDRLGLELYRTSIKLTGPTGGKGALALVQGKPSAAKGTVRYSTRVSLFTGEGSRIGSGIQEAGLLILGEPAGATEFNSTFIGVAFDRSRADTPGRVRYRVGNGQDGYRTEIDIPDKTLPFKIAEGEYEIVVEHDVGKNTLSRVRINGVDITGLLPQSDRRQRISRGLFGMRASMDDYGSGVRLQQFYWSYRVEAVSKQN
jgi:hypothetical protein